MKHIVERKKKTKILLVYPNQMLQNLIPINISLLSACLKKELFDVEVFDTTFYKTEEESGDEIRVRNLQLRPFDLGQYGIRIKDSDVLDSFQKMVYDYKPDIIGYSITDDTFPLAYSLMASLKDNRAITVVGGASPTFAPEKFLDCPFIDVVCIGEGERALVELAEAVENKADYSKIKNLWVKLDGTITKNSMRPLIDLDSLPFIDLSIWEKERFFRPMQGKVFKMVPVYTDRGCPNLCTYCCAPSYNNLYREKGLGGHYRFRSTRNVMREIEHCIKNYSVEYIYFSAETFLLLKESLFNNFIREYRKISLPFWFQSRPENVTKKKIRYLVDSGADRISVGLESGNEEYRRSMLKRHFSNEKAVQCFDILSEEGLKSSVNNIIGFPDETREMIFDTIGLNKQLKTDSISVFYFTPYLGTPLRDYCIEKGYMCADAAPSDRRKESPLKMPQISAEELSGIMRTFPLYAKLPAEYSDKIERAEKFDDAGNKAFADLSKIYREKYLKSG